MIELIRHMANGECGETKFNNQATRVAVLFADEHIKLWDIAKDALKAILRADAYPTTEQKLNMFQAAAGTVLFFSDQTVVDKYAAKITAFGNKSPHWAGQAAAIQEYLTWTGLEAEGLGANLQHYNPLIDVNISETWGIPATWKLDAQLVFGGKAGEARDKTFQPFQERVKVFGA
ncbi:unnamed protein product [Clonostachys rosea f. rosea IK726]|uniref:Nitroreductase domain-containing protein n=2 Tax=Bionectria ochroleuca TaxID=29856 RepID=A0A0B7KKN1_BIOOC|nr:unnamed protein product [Clonostachys rosea f. rosea IK726]